MATPFPFSFPSSCHYHQSPLQQLRREDVKRSKYTFPWWILIATQAGPEAVTSKWSLVDDVWQDKANLARIRDNQRRSRARRKEYLQELEGKYRNCELLGVEASSEIQAAARRVAEENKLLRLLLLQRGVPESEIDDYLGRSFDQPQPASGLTALDSMLSARKPCSGDRHGCSPNLSASSSSSIPSKPISMSPPVATNLSAHSQQSPMVWSDASLATFAQSYPNTDVTFNVEDFSRTGYELAPAASDLWPEPTGYEFSKEINTDANMSSCTVATSIIRNMGAGVSSEQVKVELGCTSDMDCKVDDSTLLRVMDRYSGQ